MTHQPSRVSRHVLALLALAWALLPAPTPAQDVEADLPGNTPEGVVRSLYDMVTFPAGTTPDWDELRTLFLPETVIALRLSRDGLTVMDLDGFVGAWLRDIERFDLDASGFTERIVRTDSTEFGDIALVWVLYEAGIPGSGRPAQPGVDCIQLVRREGRWFISAIANEVPTPDREVPEVLRGEG